MSMSNLKNIDRHYRSNASVISNTGSVTSINSVGKKRRAPAPPGAKKQVLPEPISEETPSMLHLENNNNKPHRLEEIGRRVLPDLPVPKTKQKIPKENIPREIIPKENTPREIIPKEINVPKSPQDDPPPYTEQPSDRPAPAPRSSLLEEAKIDLEMPSKKKSAKKLKNKVVESTPVPSPVSPEPEVPILQETSLNDRKIERALSPDSALASSESSGSSLNRKNKEGKKALVPITPYEQFRPVVRKSRQIQEKIAIFSGLMPPTCDLSSTTGGVRVFPIPKKPQNLITNENNPPKMKVPVWIATAEWMYLGSLRVLCSSQMP